MATGRRPWNKERFIFTQKDRNYKSVNALVEDAKKRNLYFTEQDIKNANKKTRMHIQNEHLLAIAEALNIAPTYLTGEFNKKAEIGFMDGLLDIPKDEWLQKHPQTTDEQYHQLREAFQIDDDRVFMLSWDAYQYEQKANIRKQNIDSFRAWLTSIKDAEILGLIPEYPKEEATALFSRLPDQELIHLQFFMIKALCEHYNFLPTEREV